MAATADHYDVIVIGSSPGGASLAHRLAPCGKRMLMLERGDYLPRSRQNWDAKAVFVDGIHQAKETWHGEQIRAEALPGLLSWPPEMPFEKMAEHSIDFWLQSEDLPQPENRIRYDGDRVALALKQGSQEAAKRLRAKLQALTGSLGAWPHLIDRRLHLGKNIPTGGAAHQAGTCRFGIDPASSVLDVDCKAHEAARWAGPVGRRPRQFSHGSPARKHWLVVMVSARRDSLGRGCHARQTTLAEQVRPGLAG